MISRFSLPVCLVLFMMLSTTARSQEYMMESDLVSQGYTRVGNTELMTLIKTRHISIRDLVTGELYQVTRPTESLGRNEKIDRTRPDNSGSLLSTEAVSRAPVMLSTGEYTVEGDFIVVRDDIRRYQVKVYRKGERIYGTRDIDNGKVYFEVVPGND